MRGDPAGPVGMRRVSWVRIERSDDGTRCEVAGIGHRVPVVRTVPLSTAAALVADGVPVVITRRQDVRAG